MSEDQSLQDIWPFIGGMALMVQYFSKRGASGYSDLKYQRQYLSRKESELDVESLTKNLAKNGLLQIAYDIGEYFEKKGEMPDSTHTVSRINSILEDRVKNMGPEMRAFATKFATSDRGAEHNQYCSFFSHQRARDRHRLFPEQSSVEDDVRALRDKGGAGQMSIIADMGLLQLAYDTGIRKYSPQSCEVEFLIIIGAGKL